MNHIVGRFRQSCTKHVQLYGLHRKGKNSTDLHGSDLGISVSKGNFQKIAFLQVKRIASGKVELEHHQLDDAMTSGFPKGMFFILAVDPSKYEIRIGSVDAELSAWPSGSPTQAKRRISVSTWDSLEDWASKWLQCQIGGVTKNDFERATKAVKDYAQHDSENRKRTWLPSVLLAFELPKDYQDYEFR